MTADSTPDPFLSVYEAALAGMLKGPQSLSPALAFHAGVLVEEEGQDPVDVSETAFREVLNSAHSDNPLLWIWRKQLTKWDAHSTTVGWTDTEPRTDARRAVIHDRLRLATDTRKLLDERVPVSKMSGPVVISTEFTPWRSSASFQGRNWYWPKYAEALAGKGWAPDAIASIDEAAESVVERLANPAAEEAYQSRGLVVGYVQSGKTANFTGVIAKAVDAGYRLVIVLGGTLNLLRAQTQRRLDMELVGRENILSGAPEIDSDYADDPDWVKVGKFLSHGGQPSEMGAFDIIRLTTRDNDYKSLAQGIAALKIEKREQSAPVWDSRNLHHSNARLMVVKKNKSVLTKLVKDLKKIGHLLPEIPVLIIDDESDEASVNTTSPNKPDANRTAINQQISALLKLLPRAQYVGYTATPFANVFVDPSDTEDIFPKDFIISLARPGGYMGVQDFHDLDSDVPPEERTVSNSNEKAHVRGIVTTEEEEADEAYEGDKASLREAMDMFVLTAAMKIYRESCGPEPLGIGSYTHHTMLVHESRLKADHRALNNLLLRLWEEGGYTGAAGHERLRELFDRDIAPVSAVHHEGFAVPASYDELRPHIGPAYMRIGGSENPTVVVNGDKDIESGEADFDKRGIWKILIGGQKLSRGYTVEGLTVTYYRRAAANASTMMQMGRWFGFRRSYRDLIRLYISRSEEIGKKDVDLYEAFEAICLDEETFREQLKQYAVTVDGKPQITPAQVPPIVSQHLPWLKPTSPNKMYNARLVEVRSPGRWQEPTAYPETVAGLRHNTEAWLPVLEQLSSEAVGFAHTFDLGNGEFRTDQFEALTRSLGPRPALELMRSLQWSGAKQFAPNLAYLEALTAAGEVDDWLVVAPQHVDGVKQITLGQSERRFSWFARKRRRGSLFGAVSEPRHRGALLRIAGALPESGHPATDAYAADRRGIIAVYPVVQPADAGQIVDTRIDPSQVVMAFSFIAPTSAWVGDGQVLRFTTIDSSRENEAIIEV